MERYIKFLKKINPVLRNKIITAIEKIVRNDVKNLDVKALHGSGEFYRCRVGKVRIIFERRGEFNIVHDIGFRGGIYS
ncbi:MAG: type II toxin-antitoxin system RelE/ParE family toxin [Patescibacteria group bacterium]